MSKLGTAIGAGATAGGREAKTGCPCMMAARGGTKPAANPGRNRKGHCAFRG